MASSSSSAAPNRDGSSSSSPEDDAVLSATRAFAQEALLQFQSGKFDQCLTALQECLKRKSGDPNVIVFRNPIPDLFFVDFRCLFVVWIRFLLVSVK